MTINTTQLILETTLCLACFLGLYFSILKRETFFQWNRAFLLITASLSFVIPFFRFSFFQTKAEVANEEFLLNGVQHFQQLEFQWIDTFSNYQEPIFLLTIGQLLLWIYLIGVTFGLIRMVLMLVQVYRFFDGAEKEKEKGYTLVRSPHHKMRKIPAASFFGYIFTNDLINSKNKALILEHERVHIRQWHTIDLLWMEGLTVINWFNPLIYIYRKELKLIHEFIADKYVSTKLTKPYEYAQVLVKHSIHSRTLLVNTFHFMIKNRLKMLAQSPSNPQQKWKYLLFLPLFVALLTCFSFDLVEDTTLRRSLDQWSQTTILTSEDAADYYQLRWDGGNCKCIPGEFANFYRCENISMQKQEVKKLQKSGLHLFRGSEEIPLRNVQLQTKNMLKIKGVPLQFDQLGEWNEDSPFWKKLKKGEVLRFNFEANEKDNFEFFVTYNDKKQQYPYDYVFDLGQVKVPVDLTSNAAIQHVPFKVFEEILDNPISLIRNKTEKIKYREINTRHSNPYFPNDPEYWTGFQNSFTMSELQNKKFFKSKDGINVQSLSEGLKKNRRYEPGDGFSARILSEDGRKFQLAIRSKNDPDWTGPRRNTSVKWGNMEFKLKATGINMPLSKFKELQKQPLYFSQYDELMEVSKIETISRYGVNYPKTQDPMECRNVDWKNPNDCLKELLDSIQEGTIINILLESENTTPVRKGFFIHIR